MRLKVFSRPSEGSQKKSVVEFHIMPNQHRRFGFGKKVLDLRDDLVKARFIIDHRICNARVLGNERRNKLLRINKRLE